MVMPISDKEYIADLGEYMTKLEADLAALREENARLRQRVEELERERDAAWAVRDAGWVQTEDALTRMRTAEARLARCVEALELGLALAEGALIDFKHYGLKTDDDISKRIETALAAVRGGE